MECIKVADYAEFKGQSKQAIYKSKKVKKTKLEDGSTVIMLADIPPAEMPRLTTWLNDRFTIVDTTDNNAATVDNNTVNELNDKLNAMEAAADAARELAQGLQEQVTVLEKMAAVREQMIAAKDKEIELLNKIIAEDERHIDQLQKLCDQAQILLATKVPDKRKPWLQLLPWHKEK